MFQVAALLGGGLLTVAFSAGLARNELSSKEDASAHAADVGMLRDAVREERQLRELQQLRDSAALSAIIVRITDVACEQNPRRRYCERVP